MYLADSHAHTSFSFDGENTPEEMCLACIKAGISEVAFTDHYEILPVFIDERAVFDVGARLPEMKRLKEKYKDKLKVLSGIELGEPSENTEEAADIIKKGNFDFVLASVHSLSGVGDFYFLDYGKIPDKYIDKLFSEFLAKNTENIKIKGVNSIAHLDYMHRYVEASGRSVHHNLFRDEMTGLFKSAISNGVAIEYNFSSIVRGMRESAFTEEYLKLYRECGGEMITVGTDAHNTSQAGKLIKEAYLRLSQLGFGFVTVFREGKPEFIKIER